MKILPATQNYNYSQNNKTKNGNVSFHSLPITRLTGAILSAHFPGKSISLADELMGLAYGNIFMEKMGNYIPRILGVPLGTAYPIDGCSRSRLTSHRPYDNALKDVVLTEAEQKKLAEAFKAADTEVSTMARLWNKSKTDTLNELWTKKGACAKLQEVIENLLPKREPVSETKIESLLANIQPYDSTSLTAYNQFIISMGNIK